MAAHVLDDYYLVLTMLVTIAYQLLFFTIAFIFQFDKVTDFAGGTNFALLALLTLGLSTAGDFPSPPSARQIIASLFLTLWALRLSGFLLLRILRTGTDTRFDFMRHRFLPLLGFWILQMLWVWSVSLPVTILNSPAVRMVPDQPPFGQPGDILGILLFAAGLVVESLADAQKFTARTRTPHLMAAGALWTWSRHPNYLGDMALHFGIYAVAVSAAPTRSPALAASVIGPLFLVALLLFVSGLPQERQTARKRYEAGPPELWEAYERYLARTSILVPMPPQLYVKLPQWVKRWVLLDLPLYQFDPASHSKRNDAPGEGPYGSGDPGPSEERGV